MADYRSTLTGPQMDQAMTDMAEHNSEAWAVGKRNGIAVSSDDVTYQNNAEYYAQCAASQIVGDITDAVRWDTDQSGLLTEEAKARARNNINAAPYNDVATNLNLLDNPWWGSAEAINQRSATSWAGASTIYTIDRWKYSSSSSGNSAELRSDGIRFSFSYGSSNFFYTYQILSQPLFNSIKGKVATASVLLGDGTIKSGTTTIPSSGTATFISEGSVTVTINNNGEFTVRILVSSTIRAVKLELCYWSTLANDVPPDKGIELAKCISSTADPNDSYANSGYARSNRNLLDNPWWGSAEVINQRNLTSGNAPSFGYVIDRWKMNPSTSLTYSVGTTGITFTIPSSGYCQMIQYFPDVTRFNGKVLTCSVMMANGTIYSGTITRTNGTAQIFFQNTGSLAALLQTDNTFRVTAYTTQTIRAVKLELGSYSTLASDAPPNYAEELAKCQYYFVRLPFVVNYPIGHGYAQNTTSIRVAVPVPTPMRTTPTISYTGSPYVIGEGTSIAVTAFTVSGLVPVSYADIAATVSGATQFQPYILIGSTQGYIDLSADL